MIIQVYVLSFDRFDSMLSKLLPKKNGGAQPRQQTAVFPMWRVHLKGKGTSSYTDSISHTLPETNIAHENPHLSW